jgi:hypothetical protein
MVLIAAARGAPANEPPNLTSQLSGIFGPLVISRMHRVEIEQLTRERALKK